MIDNQIAGQDKAEIEYRRESWKNVQENVVNHGNLREFSPWRAAIWPLTDPLALGKLAGHVPCRPRGLDGLSQTPLQIHADSR